MWLSNGTNKDIFWRSAMSGGRSTVAMRKGDKLSAQAGDVSSVHKLGHVFIDQFVVECKAYKTLNYESLIKGKGKLLEFWTKNLEEAKTHGKMSILIGKQNNFPVVVCLTRAGVKRLALSDVVKIRVYDFDLYIVLWEDFLKRSPKILQGRVRL